MPVTYKTIDGAAWQWAEDYVYGSATYVVACPNDRRCEVGVGIFALGEPRGEKLTFSGEREITVIGIGSLHFRVSDGRGQCKVGFVQRANKPMGWTWEW